MLVIMVSVRVSGECCAGVGVLRVLDECQSDG